MSINLITGRPGEGKTFVAVQLMLDYLSKGIDVYSNIAIAYQHIPGYGVFTYMTEREDILSLRSGVIVLDEGQIWFNSRNWSSLPEEVQWKFQQHRKDDLHVWLITQNAKRLDVTIRELVARFARVHKIWAFRLPWSRRKNSGFRFQSPMLPTFGIGIEDDPDIAKFALVFWDMDDLSDQFKPNVNAEPTGVFYFTLTPSKKNIFNTRDIHGITEIEIPPEQPVVKPSAAERRLPVRHELTLRSVGIEIEAG